MKPELNQDFIEYYRGTVTPVAVKCADLFSVMLDIENGKPIDEANPELIKLKALVDANATWYIGLMIGDIENAIFSGKSLNLINSLSQVSGCLSSADYWKNVWNDDLSSEEAKNLKELAGLMPELLKKL